MTRHSIFCVQEKTHEVALEDRNPYLVELGFDVTDKGYWLLSQSSKDDNQGICLGGMLLDALSRIPQILPKSPKPATVLS